MISTNLIQKQKDRGLETKLRLNGGFVFPWP